MKFNIKKLLIFFMMFFLFTGGNVAIAADRINLEPVIIPKENIQFNANGYQIDCTNKTEYNFKQTKDGIEIESVTNIRINNFDEYLNKVASGYVPSDNCHHRYHPWGYSTNVRGSNVLHTFNVRYQKWSCTDVKYPVFKGLKIYTRTKTVTTKIYQKTVTITTQITPSIRNDNVILSTSSSTHADGGLSDGLGVFGNFFIPLDFMTNMIAKGMVNIPSKKISIMNQISKEIYKNFKIQPVIVKFLSNNGIVLTLISRANKKVRKGEASRIREIIANNI